MDLGIAGRRALVTGSNTGIGKGIARALAAEGVIVIVHGRDVARAERTAGELVAAGGRAEFVTGDLATAEGANAVIESVRAGGHLDILVNNAGGSSSVQADWLDIVEDTWTATWNANVLSAVRLTRAFVPAMRAAGWGRLINIGSMAATTPSAEIADYQSSKAALTNLTMSLARSLAGTGVTANVVSPGPILTPAPRHWLQSLAKQRGEDGIEAIESETARDMYGLSVHRWGKTSEIGAAVALLASTLSDFTTGTNFHIDGGGNRGLH